MRGKLYDIQDGLEQALAAVQKYGYIEKGEGRTDFLIKSIFYGDGKRFKITPKITEMAKEAIQYHRWNPDNSNFIYRAFQITERRVFDITRCGVIARMAGVYYFLKDKPHYNEAKYIGEAGDLVEFNAPFVKRGQYVDKQYDCIRRVYIMRTVDAIFVWRTEAAYDNFPMAHISAEIKCHYEHKGERHTILKFCHVTSAKSPNYKQVDGIIITKPE